MVTRKGREINGECVGKDTVMSAVLFQPEVNSIEAAVRKHGWTKHTTQPCQQKQICLNCANQVLATVTGEHL